MALASGAAFLAAPVPVGLEERCSACRRATGVHDVHRVARAALGIQSEPGDVGGVLVLDPGVLQHRSIEDLCFSSFVPRLD